MKVSLVFVAVAVVGWTEGCAVKQTPRPVQTTPSPSCSSCDISSLYKLEQYKNCESFRGECKTFSAAEVLKEIHNEQPICQFSIKCPSDSVGIVRMNVNQEITPDFVDAEELNQLKVSCNGNGTWDISPEEETTTFPLETLMCIRRDCPKSCADIKEVANCPEDSCITMQISIFVFNESCRPINTECPESFPNFLVVSETGEEKVVVTGKNASGPESELVCDGQGNWFAVSDIQTSPKTFKFTSAACTNRVQ